MKNKNGISILLLAASAFFPLSARAADVLAHWSFDELAQDGHAFPDLHGPYRALITDTSSASLDHGKDVPFGTAASLGPGGSGLSIPALPPAFYDHSFTVAAWVKLADTKDAQYLLSDWQKTNAYFFGFEKGKVTAALRNDKANSKGTANLDIISNKSLNVPISPNTWHHVAWAWEKTGPKAATLTVYLDGAKAGEVKSNPKYSANILANARAASIGFKADTKTAFHGSIDELWVFNDALSAEQVSNLMKSNSISSSEMLANASPVAPAAAPAPTPATPTTPTTPATTPPANNTPAANTPPTTPTTPTTPAATTPPADSGPIAFTTNNTPTPAAPAPTTPAAPAAANNTPSATPTTPTTPSAAATKPAATSLTFTTPNFSVKSGPTSDTTPPASDNPTEVATVKPPHYTPARIAGILASGIVSLSLSAFLFWASNERGKMRSSRR